MELTSVGWAEAHTKFMAAVTGGNPPDIAVESYGWPITYSEMGILQPVDDVIEAIGEENILPQDLKLNFYGGHYRGDPLYGTPSVLDYRKDIFEVSAGAHRLLAMDARRSRGPGPSLEHDNDSRASRTPRSGHRRTCVDRGGP